MNKNVLINNGQYEEQGWILYPTPELKDVQKGFNRTKDLASRKQLIELASRLIKGTIKTTFEGNSTYKNMLIEMKQWVAEIDFSGRDDSEDSVMPYEGKEPIENLRNIYRISDFNSINRFVREYNVPIEFLHEASNVIRNKFGKEADISLSLEGTEPIEELYLYARVLTTLHVQEALTKIDEIDEEWLLDNIDRVQGRFNFDVEWR